MADVIMEPVPLDRQLCPAGEVAQVSMLVRRLIVPNGGPFTFTGTCSYLVGVRALTVIDPGPVDAEHLTRLVAAAGGSGIENIVITHTHRDHSSGAVALQQATGARIVGCAPHVPARALALGELNPMDAANDLAYAPDLILADGDVLACDGFDLVAIATPGHTMNHLCYGLPQERALFSGDHVMAWSTSIVAPPDGAMGAYMASLERLRSREDQVFWPGHGGPVREPQRFVRALAHHRRLREISILNRLAKGDEEIGKIVSAIYDGLNPKLFGAAALSVFAHLEDLIQRGEVVVEGPARLTSRFRKA